MYKIIHPPFNKTWTLHLPRPRQPTPLPVTPPLALPPTLSSFSSESRDRGKRGIAAHRNYILVMPSFPSLLPLAI